MKRIGVLTSGGDAPGMNAAIRSVVRTGIAKGWEVFGIEEGYSGLISGQFLRLEARDVGGIIQRGGTILGSARCPEFKTVEGRLEALRKLERFGVDGLVVIGGNGSQTGAYELAKLEFPVVGVASTIDNDLYGSEITIGVDTALDVALEAIDRLKVTASSHHRAFIIEVMGRDSGYLALMTGIAGGAEAVVIPEVGVDLEQLAEDVRTAYERGKAHAIVVVAEGVSLHDEDTYGGSNKSVARGAEGIARYFQEHHERLGFDLRVTTLGHVQRGGAPGAFDRLLATRLGAAATEHFARGEQGGLMGLISGEIVATPLSEVIANQKQPDLRLLELAHTLSL